MPETKNFSARLRGLIADFLNLAHLRLELFSVEAQIELKRILSLAAFALLGIIFAAFSALFITLFIVVALWETHALLTIGIATLIYITLAAYCLIAAKSTYKKMSTIFAATRAELKSDIQSLRGKNDQ